MTADETASIIEGAAARHGVPTEALMAIANLESSGRVNADNPRSSASGLFQFVDSTAREYGLTGSKRNDPAAQAEAAAKMMATNARSLERSLGREPNAGELYLAHQQGLGGATALLRNPNRPAVDVLTEVYGSREKATQAVRLNGGQTNQSAGQFAGQWVNKANQRASLIPPGSIPNTVATQTDTQRPQRIMGQSNAPTSAASRLAPTRDVTPRLAPGNSDVYAYNIPGRTNASLEGGYGSLTPTIGQRPPIPMPRPRPVTDRDIASASGTTIGSVPSVPAQPQRLPTLPPSSISTPNIVQTSMNRASAAVDPGLQRALEQRSNMVDTSMQRVASAVDPALQRALEARNAPGVGLPPATRSVASVPVPASPARPTGPALSRDSVAQAERGSYMARVMPNMRSQVAEAPMPTTAVPNAIPGPSRVPQVASRLPATQWGVPDALLAETGVIPSAVPDVGVASAMSVVPGFPPLPRNRPLRSGVNVQMPTPMGQRPTLPMPRAAMGFPTALAQRPNPNALRVTVNGANSYSGGGSSGGSSGGSQPRYVMKGTGKEVSPQVINWFNPDAPNGGAFEKRTVYR